LFGALEEPKTTKNASEEEKNDPVYIIYLIGNIVKVALRKAFSLFRALKKNTPKNTLIGGLKNHADNSFNIQFTGES
jgi:hypothetical protein